MRSSEKEKLRERVGKRKKKWIQLKEKMVGREHRKETEGKDQSRRKWKNKKEVWEKEKAAERKEKGAEKKRER